jgi:Na+/H+ antiporter NhaA
MIGSLSFGEQNFVISQVAVLAASLAAGSIGYFCLRFALKDDSL